MKASTRFRSPSILRASIAALALLAALPAAASVTTLAPATRMRTGDQVLGTLAQSKPVHVVVGLKLRNQGQLDAFLADPHHAVLTPAQFEQAYSPTPAQAAAVVNFLQQSGFTHVTVAPNRLLVSGDAPAGTAQAAFHTQLVSVHTHDGRNAYANATPIQIPTSLQTTVHSVLGLQTVHEMHSFARLAPASSLQTLAVTSHNPTEFPAIYGASSAPTASGVTVAIVTQGSMTNVLNDLKTFTSNNGLPSVTTQVIDTGAASTDTSGDPEWDLDSQDIVGMAGGQVGKLIFYTMPTLSDADFSTDINKVVSDDTAKIINISLGGCETYAQQDGSAATNDTAFAQAVAQGQTFSVAAGDSGADECQQLGTAPVPSWPASSRYVVAVGGTTLDASTTTWNSETVWNNSSTSATGGSPSTFEPIPSWQVGVGQNAGSSYRGVPDIAYDGDPNSGASVVVDGTTGNIIGGTSLSAPLFAGAWARVIQAKGTNVGFAAPLLYQMAANSASTHYHDVTSGSNNGETAATGWDYCSGWGSMMIDQALIPSATSGSLAGLENVSTNGTLTGSDWDGDALTYAVATPPSHGTVSITNASSGAFTYTPNPGSYGKDSFTFTATDPGGLISNLATETISVDAIPVATGGSLANDVSGFAIKGQLKGNDPDGDAKLTYSIATPPAHGTASVNATTGAVTYTSNKGYTGADSFTFQVTDSVGQTSPVGTEQVNVVAAPLPFTSNSGSGGGGAFGLWGLLGLALLARRGKVLKGPGAWGETGSR